jgi:hypothetical protein
MTTAMRDIAEIKLEILNLVGNFTNIKKTQINPLNTNFLAGPKIHDVTLQ